VENPVPGNPRVAHGMLPAHLAPSGRCKSNGVRRLRGLARRIRSLASRLRIPQPVRQPSLGCRAEGLLSSSRVNGRPQGAPPLREQRSNP
jgi:hypothetical protein